MSAIGSHNKGIFPKDEEHSSKRFDGGEDRAAITIQRAYRAHKHRTAIQPESYEVVRREDFSGTQWDKIKKIAHDLQTSGYVVFAHAARFPEHSFFTDIRSYLDSKNPAFQSSWTYKRTLRSPQTPLLYSNTKEYFQSETCKQINERIQDDGFPNNRDMLSVDGYLDNNDDKESAQYFYETNSNIFTPNDVFLENFLKEHIQTPCVREFLKDLINKNFKKLKNITEPFINGQGRLYLIAIGKEMLENPDHSYVWRSHDYGGVCTCRGEHTLERFISLLENDQKGKVRKCKGGGNPQYRILTGNLEKDSTKKILALDSITASQKKAYQDFMWPIAHLIRNLRELESLSERSSYEEIVKALLRIRFEAPLFSEEINFLQYKYGLEDVLRSKMFLLASYYDRLERDLPAKFFTKLKELSPLDDSDSNMLEAAHALYKKYPSEIDKIQENGLNLQYAPEELKNNKLVVLEASRQNPAAILYAGKETKQFIIEKSYTVLTNPEYLLDIGIKESDVYLVNSVLSHRLCEKYFSKHPELLISFIETAFHYGHQEIIRSIVGVAMKVFKTISDQKIWVRFFDIALSKNDLKLCKEILDSVDLFLRDLSYFRTSFSKIFENGQSELMVFIISKFYNCLATESLGSYLQMAITKGHQVIVREIIDTMSFAVLKELAEFIDRSTSTEELITIIVDSLWSRNENAEAKSVALWLAIMNNQASLAENLIKKSDQTVIEAISQYSFYKILYHLMGSHTFLQVFKLILNFPHFKKINLTEMCIAANRAISCENLETIRVLIQACSDGENPKCAISKKELSQEIIDSNTSWQIEILTNAGIFLKGFF